MDILKLLGFRKSNTKIKPYPYANVLHLWEDDYLMLELIPNENLEFVKSETKRINAFGEEHFDGAGFTDITPISEKTIKTIEKLIDTAEIESILLDEGLERINQFHMQGVGLIEGNKSTLGFGTNKFAIMCEEQNGLLKNIWVTGRTTTEAEKEQLLKSLLSFGHRYNFIVVDWFKGEYYNLVERDSVEEFVKNCC